MFGKIMSYFSNLYKEINNIGVLLSEEYFSKELRDNPKYKDPKKLNRYEYQVYSQNGEDGILDEIFKRVGNGNKFFVEFGVEDGPENNTSFLLFKDYVGCWIESNKTSFKSISKKFKNPIQKTLTIKNSIVTPENVERLFEELHVPENFSLLSIDIDGNDYWVWNAISNYHPMVVVIEYNALFPPDVKAVMKYNPNFNWNKSCYYGASLKALELLGLKKGYFLVGCDFRGVNSFFVRKDLVQDKFLEPFTAENHYEPARYHRSTRQGHKRDFGEYIAAV